MKTKFANDVIRARTGYVACIMMLMSMHANAVSAVPTGSDLLSACRESIESGFDGMAGQMCTWYATPCNCSIHAGLPRACPPEDLSMVDTARVIIQGLTDDTGLQKQSAAEAAILILARNYPCQEVE